jgi:hypothetical protein
MDFNKPERINDKALEILQKRFDKVEPKFVKQVVDWISKFRTTSGNLVRSKENLARLGSFKTALNRFLEKAGYNVMVSGFLENFDEIGANTQLAQQELNGLDITKSFLNPFKRYAVNNVVAAMQGQGLNTNLINPIKNELLIAVNQGSSLTDVVTSIAGQLTTSEARQGVLKRISLQASRDALLQYDGIVNEAVRKSYKLDALLYVGSLVKDSRAQCERWVQEDKNGKVGLILFEDLQSEIDWADNNGTGMIPDTTPENFCQNRGGYNCRHIAYPVRSANYIKEEKPKEEAPKEPEVEEPKFVEAKTIEEAKAKTKEIFNNTNVPIVEITFSDNLTLKDLNERNKQFNNLTNSYKLEGFEEPITIRNRSLETAYGVVNFKYNNVTKKTQITNVNFGDKTDPTQRIQTLEEEKKLFLNGTLRSKSRVDKKNNKLATLTHEFAHFTTLTEKIDFDKTAKIFFKELKDIETDYKKELLNVANTDDFFNIFLGDYANTNLDEFLAEGFTEYKLRKKPSKYALKIGKLFDKYYKK